MQIDALQTGVKGASNDKIGGDIYTIDLYNYGANGTIGAGLENKVSIRDRGIGYVKGIYYEDSHVVLGDRSRISVQVENSNVFSDYGAHVKGKSSLAMGNDSTLSVSHQGGTTETIRGVYVYPDSIFSAGDNLHLDVTYGAENQTGTVYGILNEGTVNLGKNARITVTAPNERAADTMAVYSYKKKGASASQISKVTLGDGSVLTVNSKAENKDKIINTVVKMDKAGQVTFDGGMTLIGSRDAIYSTDEGSSVTALKGGRKVILGDLESANKGSINLELNTGDSYMVGDLKSATGGSIKLDLNAPYAFLRGKSTVKGFNDASAAAHGLMTTAEAADSAASSGDTELTVADGARWDMTGTSQLTTLTHENGGVVNMAYNPELQRLDVGTYNGNSGVFRMKSDLNELETAGNLHADKVYIQNAAAGSKGLIQVHDQSFLTGYEVTGTKYQLLITDASRNATFSGLTLDEGGLWDVTPTIQNGSYVRNTMGVADARDTEWYLTKLTKSVNTDTKPLLGAVDYGYGLYRNSIDTLRQRMGDLRFLKNKRDAAGIWARSYGGELDGPGYDSKYHAIQVGYDYAANDKSLYGFLGERGIASPHYDYGSSKDHSLAGAIYGTWFGDSGSYTDVVAKWGRDDSNLHTYGPYADSANFRTSSESLSVEYGKTTKLNGHGLFIEPQAQLVLGRLNDKDFTTARGKTVHLGSYDSAIGRLGFVFGQRRPDASRPYDYYLKASVLHEFGGDRSFHMAAPDGERMDLTNHYGSTWYEAGFGGTYRVNNSTYLYADAERSFGSDWHKKWQANVGINWQF
jgi:outer membrane autotransporter protein